MRDWSWTSFPWRPWRPWPRRDTEPAESEEVTNPSPRQRELPRTSKSPPAAIATGAALTTLIHLGTDCSTANRIDRIQLLPSKMTRAVPVPFDHAARDEAPYQRTGLTNNATDKFKSEGNGVGEDTATATADELLNVLGYEPELARSRSTFQVAFMSFVLASVPYGLATTLYTPVAGGGPVAVLWGWCGVCVLIMCLAVSLGEITSVYPTAGGVYYQTFMMSPPRYRRVTAWICGWAYTLGNICITLSVNFGTTLFVVACINIFQDSTGTGIWATETYQIWLLFVAITTITNLISSLGNRWLPLLDVSVKAFLM